MPSGTPSSGRTSPACSSFPPSSNLSLWKHASWKHALGNQPLGLLLMLALCVAVGLTGCDTSVTPLEDSDPAPEQPSSSDLSVALLPGGMQHASSEDGPSYRCTANVLAPEAAEGYRTYELALAFPDSMQTTGSSESEPAFTELNFTLSLDSSADSTSADSTSADSTARQAASRVRCSIPPTEAALALMDDRIKADLQAQFGEDDYWFADPGSTAQGNSQSSGQGGAAVSSKYMQDPGMDCDWNYDNSISTCDYESGPVVRDDPIDDPLPIYIPSPPQPDPYTPPSGPGDDGSSDPGGGSSDPADCTGTLQGPMPESTTAHPASENVPTWLIPQPDPAPAVGSDYLDPDYPDNPTPADPPGGTECDGEDEGTNVTPWDVADWASLGLSLNEFIQDPSLENLGWLLLDAAGAVLPVFPALGTVRHGSDLIDSATDALNSKSIFVGTESGKVVPIPEGFTARVADNEAGIVFQKAGSTGNADMVRIMDPKTGYPEGYVVYYNKGGQPLNRQGNNVYFDGSGNRRRHGSSDPEVHHGMNDEPPRGYKDWFEGYTD